jgi:PAS domain S-box-containing protein
MCTENATQFGSRLELSKQGMLCCKFNSSHKIVSIEMMFDVMAFMLQLKQAAGSDSFAVVPNTVHTCQRSFSKPMAVAIAEPPYTIVQVNKPWEEMTGFSSAEVVGKLSLNILHGPRTDSTAVEGLLQEIRFKRPVSIRLSQCMKSGQAFEHFFCVFPLSTDSRISHNLFLTNHCLVGSGANVSSGESRSHVHDVDIGTSNRSSPHGMDTRMAMPPPPGGLVRPLS